MLVMIFLCCYNLSIRIVLESCLTFNTQFYKGNWILSQNLSACFLPEFYEFSLKFFKFAYYLCFSNVSASTMFLLCCIYQSQMVFNMFVLALIA